MEDETGKGEADPMPGRRPRTKGGTVTRHAGRSRRVVVSVLLGLILFEGGLRILLGNFGQSKVLMRSSNTEVCLELRPNIELTYTGWKARVAPSTMRTNRHGARGGDFPDRTNGDTLRIAATGDSFTFGQGVEEEDAFVQVAGSLLESALGPTEVLNFGVPGHATPQSVALVQHRVIRLKPDVVLVHVFANDLSAQESYCVYGQGGNALTAWGLRNVYVARLLFLMATPLLRNSAELPQEGPGTSPEERFLTALRDLAELGQQKGFLPSVVLLTDREMFLQEQHCRGCTPAHDLLAKAPVHVIDLSSTWLELQENIESNFILGDDHLSAAGNQRMGRALSEALLAWPALRARTSEMRSAEDGSR